MKPTIGRIVHFVMGEDVLDWNPETSTKDVPVERPAIIVRVWSDTCVQLQVFTDGTNDGSQYASGVVWATSVPYDETKQHRTWHWPERDAE